MTHRGVWVGVGLAVVVIGVFFAARSDAPAMPAVRVQRKDVSTWIASNGKVEPTEPRVIVARVDSFVRDVRVRDGSVAAPGQVLLTLDATDLEAQLARAREEALAAQDQIRMAMAGGSGEELGGLERDKSRADAELATLDRDRDALRRLVATQAATPEELAQAELAFERARTEQQFLARKRADLEQRAGVDVQRGRLRADRARATIALLEQQVRSTEVTAPIAGTVYNIPVHAGQHVQVGDVLAEVADLHRVRVRAFIDEPELGSVSVGQAVLITWDAMAGRSWRGQTEQLPKAVVPRGGRSVGEVLCSVENGDQTLFSNVNVDVRVRVQTRPRALTVPRAAVRGTADDRYVFVVRDDTLRRQPVNVGIASTNDVEIAKGLAEGDLVALPGDADARDGMVVRSVAR